MPSKKQKNEQRSSHPFAKLSRWKIVLLGLILTLLSAIPILMAQDATKSVDDQCAADMRTYLDGKGKEFLDAMDKHFKNPSSTTSLIPLAAEKYDAYKQMIRAQLDVLESKIGNGSSQTNTVTVFSKCEKVLDDHLYQISTILRDHIKRNSSAKRSFIMTSEYQRINDKMANLSRQVGQMKGYFQVLDSKLENFVPKCVKQ